jgi:hypothetical protein
MLRYYRLASETLFKIYNNEISKTQRGVFREKENYECHKSRSVVSPEKLAGRETCELNFRQMSSD